LPQILALKPEHVEAFRQLKELYRSAILRSEQKSFDQLDAMLASDRYVFLAARSNETFLGFAIVFIPGNRAFGLIEYMAVDARQRSRGLGRMLFEAAVSALRARAPGAPCVLEVDQPSAQGAALSEAERRLKFYARQGCKRIAGLSYMLPLRSAGAPPPMFLLVRLSEDADRLPRDTIATWLVTLYVEVYGCPATDTRIDMMLSSLEPTVRLMPIGGDGVHGQL